MTAPTAVATVPTAEFHARIAGLLQHWKSPESTAVEFSIPGLWYSPPSPSEDTGFRVMSKIHESADPGSEEQCVLNLKSGNITDWLRGEWIAEIELGTIIQGGYHCFKTILWDSSRVPPDTIGYYYGSTSFVSKFLSNAAIPDELHIRMRLRRSAPSTTNGPHSLTHELKNLRTSVDRLDPTLRLFNRHSTDITRISFSSRDGPLEYLYVPTQLLLKYAYFQACHTSGFSETEAQPGMEQSDSAKKDTLPANEDSDLKEVSESKAVSKEDLDSDVDSDLDVDSDSDAEWELEEEEEESEPSVDLKFKATIHVKDISRRTYKAFIDWALCGALHFAPRRAEYTGYVESCKTSTVEDILEWPVWAENNCTTINDFGTLKTLTSPRSLYRLADKLLIPGLKSLCRQQIIENFQVATVIQEISNIRDHPELLKDAYEYVKKNWDVVVQQKNFVRIILSCPRSSLKDFHQTILTKLSPNE